MKNKIDKRKQSAERADKDEKANLPGYPSYPDNEDIYIKDKEEKNVDPEDISKTKEASKNSTGKNNAKDFIEDEFGSGLDIPGSELDDEQEKVGNEDEENNYYSLGGGDHKDLDED